LQIFGYPTGLGALIVKNGTPQAFITLTWNDSYIVFSHDISYIK
jgi:hypothetical protein